MISLIVATVNRVDELQRLLNSLDVQTFREFEVIVVDQNVDDRLVPVLREHSDVVLRHVRCGLGVSMARNVGLRIAAGDIIAVPDDDCWYPPNLLADLMQWFKMYPTYDVLLVGARDPSGKIMTPLWPPGAGRCTKESVLYCAAGAFSGFMRARVIKSVGFFNEEIGPGTDSQYKSGEDIDYFIRTIALGFHVWYEPSFTVYHTDFASIERLRRVSYGYSLGYGHLLRMHGYSWWYFSKVLARSLGGIGVNLCKGDLMRASIYVQRVAGQFQGYVFAQKMGQEAD
jgi:glycosyltransferase involved in cell wall biosynthesis